MKKIILLILVALSFSTGLFAQVQKTDQRTIETKIADFLMKLPAQNSADHDKLMAELSAMGEPAFTGIAANLLPPRQGNDLASRYAISGLVKYLAKGNDKEKMKICASSLCKSIESTKYDEVKDFLLQELQYVAGNESVATVSSLLLNERLCDPAARVLVRINTDQSNQALLEALPKATPQQQPILVEALGQTRYVPATEKIRELATSENTEMKKVAYRALAESGDFTSSAMLAAESRKAGYTYEQTDALGSYLLLLKRLSETDQKKLAETSCKQLIEDKSVPTPARSSFLKLYADMAGENAFPAVLKALDSPDKQYRMAAEIILKEFSSPKSIAQVLKKARKTKNPELKAELIPVLAGYNDKNCTDFIIASLNDKNKEVQMAAIPAAAKSAKAMAVDPLIELIKTGDGTLISAAKSALLTIEGSEVTDKVALALPQSPANASIAFIEILGKRNATRHSALVFNEASDSDLNVRLAAANALQQLATAEDAEKIASLLNKATEQNEITALQEALFAAVKQSDNQEKQVALLENLMNKSGDKQLRYYLVLAKTGGAKSLSIVENAFEKGIPDQKEAALKALTHWSDYSALDALFRISKNNPDKNFQALALESYISGINPSKNTTDQKVLMFRKAMELAHSVEHKKQILQQISKNSTMLSLVFVSQYLDNPELQQTAVQAVNAIVLANSGLYGAIVEEIAGKAINLNMDAEANYQKQNMLNHLSTLPKANGFVTMFNGKDLSGWKGLVENPVARAKMNPQILVEKQKQADERMRNSWKAINGILVFEGNGDNLCSEKLYGDFELILDWRMEAKGDGGIYLRGSPQVQTWDTSRVEVGAQVGSGGLYNNQKNASKPLVVADNPINDWNTFRITMTGEKVTVYLNGKLVVDNVTLENYWDRSIPIFSTESIELQAHGTKLEFRDIFIREIPRPEPYRVSKDEEQAGFVAIFNGIDMTGWSGNTTDYTAIDGMIVCKPTDHGSGNLYTAREYSDFILRFEFQLTPGANNGLGIRTPREGDAAYVGMELQILDNEADIYKNLQPYQYHGSVYGVIPAKRGYLKPVGEWNYQEVQAIGNKIKVTLNGEVILEGDIAKASKNGTKTMDKNPHPGLLNKSGYIGFLGHGSPLQFRNLRIKDLEKKGK
jgi:HEAT repeat protein